MKFIVTVPESEALNKEKIIGSHVLTEEEAISYMRMLENPGTRIYRLIDSNNG